jgi:nucleoside triphosphate diphosphatase
LDASRKAAKGTEELGDLLLGPLARHLNLDPEDAFRIVRSQSGRGFHALDGGLEAERRQAEDAAFEQLDALRLKAKNEENEGV